MKQMLCGPESSLHAHRMRSLHFTANSALVTIAADDETAQKWKTDTLEVSDPLRGGDEVEFIGEDERFDANWVPLLLTKNHHVSIENS